MIVGYPTYNWNNQSKVKYSNSSFWFLSVAAAAKDEGLKKYSNRKIYKKNGFKQEKMDTDYVFETFRER